jgi:DNA-directed RNA polymerase subunit RPC12/RpoP
MTKATYFDRACPTCGRQLAIRVELIGKEVSCQHCGGHFKANLGTDGNRDEKRVEGRIDRLLAQADQYLSNNHLQGNFFDPTIDS